MAGLIGLQASDMEIQDALGAIKWEYEGWIPHPVVRLTTTMPVAVNRPAGRTIARARWGFPVGSRPVGNARDDRLLESPLWSGMLGRSHGLVAATGVYEMAEGKPYWFRRVDGKLIVMPALVGDRSMKEEARLCAAIVTTAPNAFFGQFHDRQVCALDMAGMEAWMNATDPDEAMAALRAPGLEEWEAVPVDGRIFKPGRVEKEHLVEVGKPVRWTGAPKPLPGVSRQASL